MRLDQRDRPGDTYLELDVNAESLANEGSILKIGVSTTVSLLVRTTGRGWAYASPVQQPIRAQGGYQPARHVDAAQRIAIPGGRMPDNALAP